MYEPPNIPDFDGPRNGRIGNFRQARPIRRNDSLPAVDPSSTILQTVLPLVSTITSLAQSVQANLANSRPPLAITQPQADSLAITPRRPRTADILSPAPKTGDELKKCIADMASRLGIDLSSSLAHLQAEGYTPEALLECDIGHLQRLTGLPEGKACLMRRFCRKWVAQLEEKRRAQT